MRKIQTSLSMLSLVIIGLGFACSAYATKYTCPSLQNCLENRGTVILTKIRTDCLHTGTEHSTLPEQFTLNTGDYAPKIVIDQDNSCGTETHASVTYRVSGGVSGTLACHITSQEDPTWYSDHKKTIQLQDDGTSNYFFGNSSDSVCN